MTRSLKSQSFKQWELAELGRHETVNTRSENCCPRATGSIAELPNGSV